MRACLDDHVFIRPPERGRAGMRIAAQAAGRERRCVVWLDDVAAYLGGEGLTSQLLDRLLAGSPPRHVVVLATMRVEERDGRPPNESGRATTAGLGAGVSEVARERREVLDHAQEIRIDRTWSRAELDRASAFAGDERIAAALEHTDRFGLAEYLAAGQSCWKAGVTGRRA